MGLGNQIKNLVRSNAIRYERGLLEILGIRGVVYPAPTQTFLLEEIYESEDLDLLDVMENVGYRHGQIAVKDVGRKNKVTKNQFAEQVITTANVMGLGKLEVETYNFENSSLTVSITDSPYTKTFSNSEILSEIDKPIHSFWVGALKAMAEAMFETDVEARETNCEYLGDKKCLIICEGDKKEE